MKLGMNLIVYIDLPKNFFLKKSILQLLLLNLIISNCVYHYRTRQLIDMYYNR